MRELPLHVDARRFERLDLIQQRRRIDHHAVADHRLHARPQNAARNQLQDEFLLADEYGVAGVVPALIARHDVEVLREQVDDLPFALVSPLRAQDDDVSHVWNSKRLIVPCERFAYPVSVV